MTICQDGFRMGSDCVVCKISSILLRNQCNTRIFALIKKSTKGVRHEFGRTQYLNCGKRDNTKMARSLLNTQRYQLRPYFRATGRLSWWGLLLIGFAGIFRLNPGPLLTNGKDVLPPNLVKSRNRGIGFYNVRFALKLDRHLGSDAAEMPVQFQSDWKSLNPNLAASRLQEIF